MTKILAVVLGCVFALCGCNGGKEKEIYKKFDYTATHSSKDNILNFSSSDSGLDSFLNEYFERHMRYTDNRIHTHPVGFGGSAWKEWEALIGSWWDSSASFNKTMPAQYATKDLVTDWLLKPKMDSQGYVWQDEGLFDDAWGAGWAFPNYQVFPSHTLGYDFNNEPMFTTPNDDVSVRVASNCPLISGTALMAAPYTEASEIVLESGELELTPLFCPNIILAWAFNNRGDKDSIDDLYVYFQTKAEPNYSEDKMAKYSENCTTGSQIVGNKNYDRSYFSMYTNEKWGRKDTGAITKLKFVLKAKEGKKIKGDLGFNFLRCEYDSRQCNNVGNYVTAAKSVLEYSQSKSLLEKLLPNVRKATMHYLELLGGKSGLITTDYYVGHDGSGDATPGQGIGNGYWDVLGFPAVNMYTNLTFYRAVKDALFIEQMAKFYNVDSAKPTIKNSDFTKDITYSYTIESLTELEKKVKKAYNDTFWDEQNGRYIGGWYGSDVGNRHAMMDNGFLEFNLEAVDAGLSDASQSEKIISWLTGEREISGDNSVKEDIYFYEFSPRFTTKQNIGDYMFAFSGGEFGQGVHNGGAVMQDTYYDFSARVFGRGADCGFSQVKNVQKWFEKVKAAGGRGDQFYREYYKQIGIAMQGGGPAGPVGLDYEFLEAALMFVAVPRAFFGLSGGFDNTLNINPSMPSALDYWKMENLTFANSYYDCTISNYFVQISNVHDAGSDKTANTTSKINFSLRKPNFNFKVLLNGKPVEFKEVNGRIAVTAPYSNCKVEIVEA